MPIPRRGYPSDLTDAQWALIEPMLPESATDGRPEKHPPWQTVYWYFARWEEAGVTEKLLAALRVRVRAQAGRAAEPSAGIIGSQSVKGADTVGVDSRGYDAGKKINGRKRFIVTDTLGLLVTVGCWPRRGRTATAPRVPWSPPPWPPRRCGTSSPIRGSPAGWSTGPATGCAPRSRSSASPPTRAASPYTRARWVVERTLAWLTACRRLARDYERVPEVSEAIIRWAAIAGMARRITRGEPARRQTRRTFVWT